MFSKAVVSLTEVIIGRKTLAIVCLPYGTTKGEMRVSSDRYVNLPAKEEKEGGCALGNLRHKRRSVVARSREEKETIIKMEKSSFQTQNESRKRE